jgi:putative ABC transport system permease protein
VRLACREIQRHWRRFGLVVAALCVLAVLVLTLGGMLDGIDAGLTGALRSQRADLVVFSSTSRRSIPRSRIDPPTMAAIRDIPGVAEVRGLGVALLGVRVPGRTEPVSVAVIGYQGAVAGVADPPPAGVAWADRQLRASGVEPGQRLRLGGAGGPEVEVGAWAPERSLLLQPTIWVNPETWRAALAASRPDATLPSGTLQVGLVTLADLADPSAVADAIDEATGTTDTVSKTTAILAMPGLAPMRATFAGIIGATLAVVGVVVTLFFSLLAIEHRDLYRMLKAVGASGWQLARTLIAQAVAVTVIAVAASLAIARGLAVALPADIPLRLDGSRELTSAAELLAATVAGSLLCLRRALRADPAQSLRARR